MSAEVKKIETSLDECGKIIILLTNDDIDDPHSLIKLEVDKIIEENNKNCIFELIDESCRRPYLHIVNIFNNKVGHDFNNLKWKKFPKSNIEYVEFDLKDNENLAGNFIFMRDVFSSNMKSFDNLKNIVNKYIDNLIKENNKKYNTYNVLIDKNFDYNFCYRWILLNIDKFNFQ